MAAGFEVTPEDMRHIPVTDNHSRLVFCEQIKGFTPILRDNTRYCSRERECSTLLRYTAESSTPEWCGAVEKARCSRSSSSFRTEFCLAELSGNAFGKRLFQLLG